MKRSRIDAMILAQEQLNTLDRAAIEAIQLKKLNRLLAAEQERGGFYRGLPGALASLDALSELPFTTDEELAHHAAGLLLLSQSRVQRVLSDATSGTTGAAKRVFYTEKDLESTVQLYTAGLGELVFPGSVTLIGFPFSGPFGLGELIAEAIERLGARAIKAGPGLSYGEYAALLKNERPDTFVGMPVQLLSILRGCGKGSLKRALVSGDACPKSVIEAGEAILSSRLYPHYGSREMGMAGAITCEAHEGMHLRENCVIAEIVDPAGQVLPRGEWGELVITTVGMEALPLIRYRTGDYTRILPEPCPCHSATLRLDTVSRMGEREIEALDNALFPIPELVDYRAERDGEKLYIRALVTTAEGEEKLQKALRDACPGPKTECAVSFLQMSDHALYRGKRTILRGGNT